MKHSNIPPSHDVNQLTRFNVPNLHEVRLKGKYVWVREGKCVGVTFPADLPIWTSPPTVTVDKEREITIVKKKFPVQSLNMNGLDVFPSSNKVKRRIGLVQQRLRLGCLKTNHLETTRTTNTES